MSAWIFRILDRLGSPQIPTRRVLKVVLALGMALVGATYLFVHAFGQAPLLLGEDGVFEAGSVVFHGLLACIAIVSAIRTAGRHTRLVSAWVGWIATLAALRELDLHVMLNPRHLAEWGVRYRMDWWLSGEVSLQLKVAWIAVFGLALLFTVYPIWKCRNEVLRLCRSTPVSLALVGCGVGLMALGVVIDDPLRNVHVVSKQTKSLVEEGIEWFGAGLFCGGTVVLLRAQARKEREIPQAGVTPPA